jgi:predicted MFS family arabinose efflux permease
MDIKLLSLLVACFFEYTVYTLPGPFYPIQADTKEVPLYLIGIVIGFFPLVALATSPILAKYLERVGRRMSLTYSMLLTAVGFCIWGALPFMGYGAFVAMSFIG